MAVGLSVSLYNLSQTTIISTLWSIEKGKGKGHTTIAKEAEGYDSDVLVIKEEVVVKEEPVERVTQFQTEIHDGHEVILID
jgi:hypothetical protein